MRISDVTICLKHDAKKQLWRMANRLAGRSIGKPLPSRVPVRKIKNMILREGFATIDGKPSWFYTAYARGSVDPLTNHAFEFVSQNVKKGGNILVTGCGTGITACHFADQGYQVDGIDLLPECIAVADKVRAMGGYNNLSFRTGDGFNPQLDRRYDAMTALHWVFSAWMGNYGNTPAETDQAKDPAFREQALTDLLSKYAPHLNEGGYFLIELTDAVSDYRIPTDHPMGDYSAKIYPVRHTPEQVERCAEAVGLAVIDKKLCVSYGHHPRTLYVLKK